jgi:hypothetical protein
MGCGARVSWLKKIDSIRQYYIIVLNFIVCAELSAAHSQTRQKKEGTLQYVLLSMNCAEG